MSAINQHVRAAIAKVAMTPSHVAYRSSVANWRTAQKSRIHTIKLVDLHTTLHLPKDEPLRLHGLKLHDTLPVPKVTGSAIPAAREMSTSTAAGDKAKIEKNKKNISDLIQSKVENGALTVAA